ncbi:MAG: DUF4325 domain-containing protein [Candidatus Moranbacteria bacterium]|nr:DUF4325 domain-containing protein [Candidatus Moranbacteria bacterium]
MNIVEMKKFGVLLNGRPEAKEAVARVRQMINGSRENICVDFSGIEILTPSFADEFLRGLSEVYPEKIIEYSGLEENAPVQDTLKIIGIKI